MTDPIDVYVDQFEITTGPYGCTMNLQRSSSAPPTLRSPVERVATIRMSLEHLKVMAFVLQRQVRCHEQQSNCIVAIPGEVLNGLQIGPEDWKRMWE